MEYSIAEVACYILSTLVIGLIFYTGLKADYEQTMKQLNGGRMGVLDGPEYAGGE